MALSKHAIVSAGLTILNTYGLGDLSMRRVADALGVQAGALYYHVPNKQSLLAAMADEILSTAELRPRTDVVEFLTGWAASLRAALLAHRDAGELVASAHALGLGTADPTAAGHSLLAGSGVPQPEATMSALLHFVLGHVIEEQTQGQMHALGVVEEFDAARWEQAFSWGVRIFAAGALALAGEG